MATMNLKDATKVLVEESSEILTEATRIRKEADFLYDALKRLDAEMNQQREEEAARRRQQEQQKAQSAHTKAFTMLDDDEKQMLEEANRQNAEASAPAEVEKAPEKKRKKAEETEAAETAEAAPAEEKKEEAPAAKKPAEPAEEKKPSKPAEPKKPAIGQIISRPGDTPAAKPATKPAQPGQPVRSLYGRQPGQPGQQGQGGPYGRPAGQGPYGRQPGQQGQGGPYGRPAGQGPYGRPAGQQGQGGPYGRPAGQQGGYGRPAGQQGQGGNRSQGGPRQGMGGRRQAPELAVPMEKERVSNYDPNKKNYVRQHDPENQPRNKKQQANRNNRFNGYDDEPIRGGKRARSKKPSAQQMMAPIKIETAYMAGDTITVRDLTEKIGKPAGEIIKKLFLLGNMATINSEIDFDTAQLVCSDFEITLEKKQEQSAEAALVAEDFEDEEENLETRPPVVTIMGHVDHGKTSLLDYIRKSRVTAGEAGGITQHIGAYTVDVDGRKITFLDTPGHEAFTAMRARGTQATDIAVLVVAADDSVMPQTVESINHAKAAEVPVIVAINKMDKPDANPEKVKQDLTQYGLVCEDWGGETICVPVSAHTGMGVNELLEMILLQADMLQLKANPNRLGRGVIIEAKLDKARGPLATVLLQNGTLHVGDSIIAGLASGKVRALINDKGERVSEAGPSMPVEIMGFDDVPSAGDEMIAVGDDHLSRQVADERREKIKASREATMAKMSMENLFSSIEAGKVTTLNLIIKADVQGSVEALKQSLLKLSNDEVVVKVIHGGVGAINESDVTLASASNAVIIGFNVRPDTTAKAMAEHEGVDVRLYKVIYQAIDAVEAALKGMLAPIYEERVIGHVEVRQLFKASAVGNIAGSYVLDGVIRRGCKCRISRAGEQIFEGDLASLKRFKDDVKEVKAGFECGLVFNGFDKMQVGDIVEAYDLVEVPRT